VDIIGRELFVCYYSTGIYYILSCFIRSPGLLIGPVAGVGRGSGGGCKAYKIGE